MITIIPIPGFTDPVSSLTHLLGALFFAVASFALIRRGWGDWVRTTSLVVFCLGTVFLLSMSGIYHMLPLESNVRTLVQRLDHSAIFLLIAGSFTPAHTILFRGRGRLGALLLIWTIAIAGIALKMIYFHEMPRWLGMSLYLGMGWLGFFSCISLWRRYGLNFMQPLVWGGLAYTIGAILEWMCWPVLIAGIVECHEVFHVAVLIGLGCHWAFTFQIADGHLEPC